VSWLLLRDAPAGGAWNMAVDAALMEAAAATGQCCLRLYAWDPPTLSFGRHEPATTRYDRAAIERRGLAVVRRPTGGRAVWHHREVTYSVTAPEATFGPLRAAYEEIHAMLADALRQLGARVALAAARPAVGVGAGACFAAAAGGEVAAEAGGKIVGSAQVREAGALLQHGSILLADDQDLVAQLTIGAAAASDARGLADLIGGGGSGFGAVADAIVEAAAARWGVPREPGGMPARVRERATALVARHADHAWIWRR
jgi:lipoyl(octanoyl) transferase